VIGLAAKVNNSSLKWLKDIIALSRFTEIWTNVLYFNSPGGWR
jgi:hypothetical protein